MSLPPVSSPSSVYLLPVEACTSYYPATRAEIANITPQKQSTLPLPTPSSKPWTLKIFSILILLDLSKAFDSMDHYILLRKISHLGASPLVHIVYSWFVKVHVPSINRIQYVRVSTVTSSMLPLTHGLPHRSTLSPLLFTIYTNDLPSTWSLM